MSEITMADFILFSDILHFLSYIFVNMYHDMSSTICIYHSDTILILSSTFSGMSTVNSRGTILRLRASRYGLSSTWL
ncbi:hypothetical protein FR483_n810L [Paramecium bursaria Chlorella virus FR483]|uniref:Uncharacterized protein n810L n=1 Tax=Paramecium bursaria Chlorella virus FR483 TaxID=399781 RepID=A7J8G4_PBCVF|nr:hypothetical protein FR483_n810L [Paramecium bursaria Chlorella virus FR483]ABT16095.1 hypothetical protein FR483_n810L [Paramecium bursaria Chlorella virus FR483]